MSGPGRDSATGPAVEPARSRARHLGYFALAWFPFYLAWGLLNFAYFDVTLFRAFEAAAYAIGSAGVLALGVWWLSGRLVWPEELRPTFYLAHLALGSAYSALWILFGAAVNSFWSGLSLWSALRASHDVGWRFLTGLWLYGLVAGVSYAVRIRRGLQRERERSLAATALAATARLDALRSQLNPHFLFNALHSLNELIESDPARAQVAVERLGALLRYSLDHSQAEVALAREWAFTRDYLELEQLRYEERLRWSVSIPEALVQARVPPFCLQIPAENAVRHGVAERSEGIELRVNAEVVGERLVLRVADDGPGADPQTRAESRGRGLGLLRDRLDVLYGRQAELRVISSPGAGFIVEMHLPFRRDGTGGGPADINYIPADLP